MYDTEPTFLFPYILLTPGVVWTREGSSWERSWGATSSLGTGQASDKTQSRLRTF